MNCLGDKSKNIYFPDFVGCTNYNMDHGSWGWCSRINKFIIFFLAVVGYWIWINNNLLVDIRKFVKLKKKKVKSWIFEPSSLPWNNKTWAHKRETCLIHNVHSAIINKMQVSIRPFEIFSYVNPQLCQKLNLVEPISLSSFNRHNTKPN